MQQRPQPVVGAAACHRPTGRRLGYVPGGHQAGTARREAGTTMMSFAPLGSNLTLGRGLVAIGNEINKGLRQAWAERVQIIIELPLFVSFALLFSVILGQGQRLAATGTLAWQFDPHQTTWFFLGFVVFTFAYLQSVKMFWRLLGEIQTGTLETGLPESAAGLA